MNPFWWLLRRLSQLALAQLTGSKAKLKTNRKRAEMRKWFKFLIHLAQKNPANPRREDYEKHWGYTSFVGKTILDLGADYGSTAEWFLSKGAHKVIAVEGHLIWAFGLRAIMKTNKNVMCIQQFIESPADIELLIYRFKPDLVKIDIEGYERLLLVTQRNCLRMVPEWLVEAHGPELAQDLLDLYRFLGYTCHVCVEAVGHMGYPSCTIFHATK